MDRVRGRLTYANVMATIAVFVALGGASYAAVNLPAKSVGTRQLKNGVVTKPKIGKNAVTGAKVKNRSLTAADFKPGQLPRGPRGATGAQGEPGIAGVVTHTVGPLLLEPEAQFNALVKCEAGEVAVGGGYGDGTPSEPTPSLSILKDQPSTASGEAVVAGEAPTAWRIAGRNDSVVFSQSIVAYAICAP